MRFGRCGFFERGFGERRSDHGYGSFDNDRYGGTPDPFGKVLVVDGVPGAGVANFDLPAPVAVLQHGAAYYYGVTTENNTYSGTCKDSFRLTQVQGAKTVVLDSGVIKSSYACTPGTTWFWVKGGKVIPNSPGPATLIGTVAYGTSKVSMSMHMVIQ